jgi:hypothetical protein
MAGDRLLRRNPSRMRDVSFSLLFWASFKSLLLIHGRRLPCSIPRLSLCRAALHFRRQHSGPRLRSATCMLQPFFYFLPYFQRQYLLSRHDKRAFDRALVARRARPVKRRPTQQTTPARRQRAGNAGVAGRRARPDQDILGAPTPASSSWVQAFLCSKLQRVGSHFILQIDLPRGSGKPSRQSGPCYGSHRPNKSRPLSRPKQ